MNSVVFWVTLHGKSATVRRGNVLAVIVDDDRMGEKLPVEDVFFTEKEALAECALRTEGEIIQTEQRLKNQQDALICLRAKLSVVKETG